MDDIEKNAAKMQLEGLLDTLTDAKEYGSILNVESCNWDLLRRFVAAEDTTGQISMDSVGVEDTAEHLNRLINIGEAMARKYWVTCTNPPYAGTSNLSANVNNFVKKNYPDSKADLFAVFIERCRQMTVNDGFQAMITQHTWMFLSSFEKLREKMMLTEIVNMAHLGARAFEEIGGEVVQTTSFVCCANHVEGYKGTYCRLVEPTSQQGKEDMFLAGENRYTANQDDFAKIPGSPVAYWVSSAMRSLFEEAQTINQHGKSLQGTVTGDNDRFMRLWFEVDDCKFSILSVKDKTAKWFPYCKGGEFRRWYGNMSHVINWEDDGFDIRHFCDASGKLRSRPQNTNYFFREGITWSSLTGGLFGGRYLDEKNTFSDIGPLIVLNDVSEMPVVLAYVNSKVFQEILDICCTGLHYQNGVIGKLPCIDSSKAPNQVIGMTENCIRISRADWDSFETSWDFKKHPLLRNVSTISEAFTQWQAVCEERFNQLKANEEELNRIFIGIYGLQDELTPEVEDKDVTVRKADLQRDIKSLLSYAVGCMFGRYSLDKPGLIFAGGNFDSVYWKYKGQAALDENDSPIEGGYAGISLAEYHYPKFHDTDDWETATWLSYEPDVDNVIPITDEEYLDDDIVSRLCAWLKAVYGADTLEENLDYIAKALGNKGSTSREIIRNYFLNDFFKDHCQTYSVTGSGKRPIYWLFDSGKQNGFKALVYLHRYTPDTIGNLRIDYLHKMQRVYESEINRMQDMMDHSGNAREVAAASKRKDKLAKQLKECREYDEKISHLALSRIELDLDDGVKVNYRKLQTAQDGKFYEVLADSKNIMVKEKK